MFGEEREYLTIKILHNDMTVMVPCENAGKAGLRRVIDEETVKKVLGVLQDDVSEMPKNWNRRFKHNRDKIKTGDIYELAEVVRNLAIREHEKGLSTGEKQMFTRAKKILASELMYALDKDEEEAEALPRRAASPTSAEPPARWRLAERMAVALLVAAGRGERLGSGGPKALVVVGGRPLSSGRSTRCAPPPAIDEIVVALPPGVRAPAGAVGVAGGARALALGAQRAAARSSGDPVRRPRRRAPAGDAGARRALPRRAAATPTRRSPPRR